jgi:hypothetical protein
MRWKKKGLIWEPNKNSEKFYTYGMLPIPLFLKDLNIIRVFFGSADKEINSRIYSLDLNADNVKDIVRLPEQPLLDIGNIGTFDDSGVVPSCVLKVGSKLFLYTVGFQRCAKVPYMLFAGMAVSENNGDSFQRVHESPILPRSPGRSISQGAPSVIFHNGIFKMWHWYSTKWMKVNGKLYMDYQIGYAESKNGVEWDMKNHTCIAPDVSKDEFAVARPFVIFEGSIFKMWYSIRFNKLGYRLGYAESKDGLNWVRLDHHAGLDVSSHGWDSEMICYPAVVDVGEKRYLFYNGNNNGETGFGCAELVVE